MADFAAQRRTDEKLAGIRRSPEAMDASRDVDASVAAYAAIARATGSDYYVCFTEFLGVRLASSRQLYLQDNSAETHESCAQMINRDHEAIDAAIEAGDGAAARDAARDHIIRSDRTLRSDKSGSGPATLEPLTA